VHGFNSAHVLRELETADLHLHHCIAGIEMAAHLVLQVRDGLPGEIPACAHITEHLARDLAPAVALREQTMQRLAGDLGDRVPNCDLDRADRN